MQAAIIGTVIAAVGVLAYLGMRPSAQGSLWFSRESFPAYRAQCRHLFKTILRPMIFDRLNGYSSNAVLAIIAWETGWLSDPNSKLRVETKHNLMGLDLNGVGRTFKSYEKCLDYFDELMHYSRYVNSAYPVRNQAQVFIAALNAAGYNSNESWRVGVLHCLSTIESWTD